MAVSKIGKDLVGEYLRRLSQNVSVIAHENGCQLVTPFIRPDGEAIGLEFASLPSGDYCISDMGDTLGYLYVNGLTKDLSAPEYVHSVAGSYGVLIRDNAMTISSCPEDVGDAVHSLIQAVQAVANFAQGRALTVPNPSDVGKGVS